MVHTLRTSIRRNMEDDCSVKKGIGKTLHVTRMTFECRFKKVHFSKADIN